MILSYSIRHQWRTISTPPHCHQQVLQAYNLVMFKYLYCISLSIFLFFSYLLCFSFLYIPFPSRLAMSLIHETREQLSGYSLHYVTFLSILYSFIYFFFSFIVSISFFHSLFFSYFLSFFIYFLFSFIHSFFLSFIHSFFSLFLHFISIHSFILSLFYSHTWRPLINLATNMLD